VDFEDSYDQSAVENSFYMQSEEKNEPETRELVLFNEQKEMVAHKKSNQDGILLNVSELLMGSYFLICQIQRHG
jgi:hypothetical protein